MDDSSDFSNHLVCLNFTPFLQSTSNSHSDLPLSNQQPMRRTMSLSLHFFLFHVFQILHYFYCDFKYIHYTTVFPYFFAMILVGRQTGWISGVKTTGFFMCRRAMSLSRFCFQLYLGWTMISSMATIFSVPLSYLTQRQTGKSLKQLNFL